MNIRIRLERLGIITSKIFTRLIVVSLIFFSACEEDPTFLGRNILPSSDDLVSSFTEDNDISIETVSGIPVVTTITPRMLLGSSQDSIFGFRKADFMTRIEVTPVIVSGDIQIDSMVFELKLGGFIGDSMTSQTYRLYELTDTLTLDSVYYSNTLPEGKYDPTELSTASVFPNDTLARLKVENEDLITRFETVDDSIYVDPGDFVDFFYGFYVTTDDIEQGGAIMYINLLADESRFIMYYHTDDTTGLKEINMPVNDYTPRVNTFYHNYEGSRVNRFMDKEGVEDTLVYISSMAGVNTRLTFPDIQEWLDKKPVAINKAQLYIPVEDTLLTGLSRSDFPARLILYTLDEDENYDFLYDYRVDESNSKSYFDGSFDASEQAYIFNIGVHLQSYIQGDVDNLNLILQSSQNSITAQEVVLKGPQVEGRKMELKIIYTEF